MSFFDHLEALRWHILRSVMAIGIIAVLVFLVPQIVFTKLIFGLRSQDFFTYKFFCWASRSLNLGDTFCMAPANFQLQSTTVQGQLMMHLQVSLTLGLVLAFPYMLWELWRFVEPALYPNEKRHTGGFVFTTSALFFIGVLFGYFILAPFCINFFANYTIDPQVSNIFEFGSYISILTTFVLVSGLMFELPMIMYLLTKVGVITPKFLRTYKRQAIVIILIVAAIITPADAWSQILVSIPLYLLYEVSILVSARTYKQRQQKLALQEAEALAALQTQNHPPQPPSTN